MLAVGLIYYKANFCLPSQKLLLIQVASGQKLHRIQQVSPKSPDSPFDYIPPKVKLLHDNFLILPKTAQ